MALGECIWSPIRVFRKSMTLREDTWRLRRVSKESLTLQEDTGAKEEFLESLTLGLNRV